MTRLEWALNKTLVFAATADRPGAREHDVSVYGPLHSCLRKYVEHEEVPPLGSIGPWIRKRVVTVKMMAL